MQLCSNCKQEVKEGQEIVTSKSSSSVMHKECSSFCISCKSAITDEESLSNQFKCTTCLPKEEKIIPNIDVIRRSYIELYKSCPYAFYNVVVKGIELPNGVYALHGIILHDLFDLYSTSEDKSKINLFDLFKERYYGEMSENHLDFKEKPELFMELYEKGIRAIKNYLAYEETAPKPFETEKKIIFSVGENLPKISITFDRVNKYGEEYELVDYKCGKVYSGQKLVTDLQLPLYALAIKERYGKLPNTFRFLFMSENKERVYHLTRENTYECTVRNRKYVVNLTEAIREVKQVLGDIQKGRFSVHQDVSNWHCERMCQLKKYEVCQGKDVQRWKL